jgi:hypothetical protein
MSGFPLNNPSDAAKFRQQYLATLALQAKNDDINLQANKIYKKTGETPTQMTDTRTTAEKRADIERLKIEVRKELRPIADGVQTEDIVNQLTDNELLFLANNITEIIKIIQPKYKLGILADVFVAFLRKYIAKELETQGVEYGLQEATGKNIITDMRQIQNLISPQVFADLQTEIRRDAALLNRDLYNSIEQNINLLKMMIPSKDFITALSQIQDSITKATIQSSLSGALSNLPDQNEILKKLSKLKIASAKGDVARVNQLGNELNALIATDAVAKKQMDSVYKAIQDALPAAGVVNPFERAAGASAPTPQVAKAYLAAAQKGSAQVPQSPIAPASIPDPLNIADYSAAKLSNLTNRYKATDKLLNSQKTPEELWTDYISPLLDITKGSKGNITQSKLGIKTLKKASGQQIRNAVILLNYLLEGLLNIPSTTDPYLQAPAKATPTSTATQLTPLMLPAGKQAGGSQGKGMKGCGLSRKSKAITIDTEGGIKPQDQYVSLGRYFINKNKLNNDIISIRTKTGHSAKIPVRRVSNNLSSVVRNILGGGMPSTDDLDKLTDDEKNYLHKLSKQSNIIDKLSIPTPNKKQLDKDINQFEIMKGQILSGNDNTDYIKKFKLLIVKLINQELLPKNQGQEILIELASLGY